MNYARFKAVCLYKVLFQNERGMNCDTFIQEWYTIYKETIQSETRKPSAWDNNAFGVVDWLEKTMLVDVSLDTHPYSTIDRNEDFEMEFCMMLDNTNIEFDPEY